MRLAIRDARGEPAELRRNFSGVSVVSVTPKVSGRHWVDNGTKACAFSHALTIGEAAVTECSQDSANVYLASTKGGVKRPNGP